MIVVMNLNYIKFSQENVKHDYIVINKIIRSLNNFERKQTILLYFLHYIFDLQFPEAIITVTISLCNNILKVKKQHYLRRYYRYIIKINYKASTGQSSLSH